VLIIIPFSVQVIPVKVLVIAMFERGKNSDDSPGEFQDWYERYFIDSKSYTIVGHPNKLFFNEEKGIAGIVSGTAKVFSAATTAVLLKDPQFNWDNTYIIATGCAGGPVDRTTLGDVVWAYELVDFDLGHHMMESDAGPNDPLFIRAHNSNAFMTLNKNLVDWAYNLTKNITLENSAEAAEFKKNYGIEESEEIPSVRIGLSITADNYWAGNKIRDEVEKAVKLYEAETPYMVTQMEDIAIAAVAERFNKLDRLLVIRDVTDFDTPYEGQRAIEVFNSTWGGIFDIAMKNNVLVGSVVVDELINNWDKYKDKIPNSNSLSETQKNNTVVIIIIVIAVVVSLIFVVLVIIITVILFYKYSKRKTSYKSMMKEMNVEDNDSEKSNIVSISLAPNEN
jgi:purine nucleoside permease